MAHFGIVNDVQLTTLTKVLDEFCTEYGIANDYVRGEVGRCIMALFGYGYATEQIKQEVRLAWGSGDLGRLSA